MQTTIDVPFLQKKDIEKDAGLLLEDYGRSFGAITVPPIPVDEILEFHLGFHLGFDDLKIRLNADDALGATWYRNREVIINQDLDPYNYPDQEGRFRFTVGHEVGHIVMHPKYLTSNDKQLGIAGIEQQPTIICKRSNSKEMSEKQADLFSACLLMPRQLVAGEWEKRFGTLAPATHDNTAHGLASDFKTLDAAFIDIVGHFAQLFRVSKQAMRFRLDALGFLQSKQLSLLGIGG